MLDKLTGINGYAELFKLGFEKDKYGAAFSRGCTVQLVLQNGEWAIDILLPNGEALGVYATPENVEVNS